MKTKVAITLGVILFGIGGLFTFFGLTIGHSTGCSQFVIDTNELHSGIDIPDVDFVNCYFDEQERIRVSIYKLELNDYYLSVYPHKFTSLDLATFPGITELEISEQPTTNGLYGASGIKWGNEWKYVVEPETGMLWVEVIYD